MTWAEQQQYKYMQIFMSSEQWHHSSIASYSCACKSEWFDEWNKHECHKENECVLCLIDVFKYMATLPGLLTGLKVNFSKPHYEKNN